jgi:gamma-carbonic anhydrase
MSLLAARIGFAIRETGQALERLGYDLGWVYTGMERYREHIYRSQPTSAVMGTVPVAEKNVFIAPCANITGDVKLGQRSSVFYNAVIRGDAAPVTIGAGTNVQDGATIGTALTGVGQDEIPVSIGENVTIGHAATLRSCTVEDEALIGMGACVLQGAVVQRGAMVAAGAVVLPCTTIPSGELWGGNPAKYLRRLKPEEASFLPRSAEVYCDLAKLHMKDCAAAGAGL